MADKDRKEVITEKQQQRWEYRVEKVKMDADPHALKAALDALGNEGWELVMGQRIFRSSQSTVVATFKRPA